MGAVPGETETRLPEMSDTSSCLTDCSVLNQTTCQPVTRRQMVLDNNINLSLLTWDEDGCYNSSLFQSTPEYESYEKFSVFLSVLMIIFGILGLGGNIFSIVVLSRKEMRNSFNLILIAINICDSFHLIFASMDAVRNSFGEFYPVHLLHIFPYVHYPFYRISLCISIYLLVGVGIERFIAVCRPHHFRQVQTDNTRSLLYILPGVLVGLIVNSPRFFETETVKICIDFTQCGPCFDTKMSTYYVKPTALRMHKQYIIYYHTWTWVFSTGLIPFIILVYLNIRILISLRNLRSRLNMRYQDENNPVKEKFREMRANQQSRDLNLAIVLISSVLMFLCCHTPRLVTSIYEAANIHSILHCRDRKKDKTPLWFMYVTATVQFLMVANASFNLPIYFFAGKAFRENTRQMMKNFIPPFILKLYQGDARGWKCFNCGTINISGSDGLDSERPSGVGGGGGGGESLEMLGVEPDHSDELNGGS